MLCEHNIYDLNLLKGIIMAESVAEYSVSVALISLVVVYLLSLVSGTKIALTPLITIFVAAFVVAYLYKTYSK